MTAAVLLPIAGLDAGGLVTEVASDGGAASVAGAGAGRAMRRCCLFALAGMVWPEDDPGKKSIDIRDVADIKDSPSRLPVQFARKLYEAGESGMGYTVFTVSFSDGSHQAYVTGNAIDFIEYPDGQTPATVVDVLPHVGRADPNQRNGPDYFWCLYSDRPTS